MAWAEVARLLARGRRHPAPFRFARSGFIEYDRVLFFSDAVFAIAITLLAIDLRVPITGKPSNGILCPHTAGLCKFGIDQPGLISFGISFAVIGLFWLGHHSIFRYIVALDRTLIGINLLFLGTIALLPYPTALLNLTARPHAAGVVFYAACVSAAGLGEGVIWLYATSPRRGLADESAAAVRLRYALRIARVPGGVPGLHSGGSGGAAGRALHLDIDHHLAPRDQPVRAGAAAAGTNRPRSPNGRIVQVGR